MDRKEDRRWPFDGTTYREDEFTVIAGYRCLLELGDRWDLSRLEAELRRHTSLTPQQRASVWARLLIGTPFCFESNLQEPPDGTLRVRLASLDCVTFIYTLVALATATSIDDFVANLARIRYSDSSERLCSDGVTGNMFHFVEESLLEGAVAQQLLEDVTERIAQTSDVAQFEVQLDHIRRPKRTDKQSLTVAPLRPGRVLRTTVLPVDHIGNVAADRFLDGDIVIFMKNPVASEGDLKRILVRHLGVIVKQSSSLTFIHSSRNFALRLECEDHASAQSTGIFYDIEQHCEQLGVDFCGQYAGEEYELTLEEERYHAMRQSEPRELSDYAKDKFDGIKILRLCGQDR